MEIEQIEEFTNEARQLFRKYNLRNCVIGGEDAFGNLIAQLNVEKLNDDITADDLIGSVLNMTRLYQSAREHLKNKFNIVLRS